MRKRQKIEESKVDVGHTVALDGFTLSTTSLVSLQNPNSQICLSDEAKTRINNGRHVVDEIVKTKQVAYGINTGFGLFSNVIIPPEQLDQLQDNLIRSHAAGTGVPISAKRTRMLLALRINVVAKGHSGISLATVERMIAAFNKGCLSMIPAKGTVGASGDLAPLAHLALGLMGEGQMWDPRTGELGDAAEILAAHDLTPIRLRAKEGLAMINGTQLIASLGSEALERATMVARVADIVCALTLEVLFGTVKAYHPLIHKSRPHHGQQVSASRIRTLLQPNEPSELFNSHQYKGKVQDAYSLRCAPQVHGITIDTISFVRGVLCTELNSATDNPMVFTQEQMEAGETLGGISAPSSMMPRTPRAVPIKKPLKAVSEITDLEEARKEIAKLRAQVKAKPALFTKNDSDINYKGKGGGVIISGGNFHGEYPAKVLDYLAIGVHELAAISERRLERMCNPSLSGLPAFLVKEGGLNSGFMIAHCTAAALVSENKVLTHPSSVDSISTSGAKEDHVSMGGYCARKALTVVEHVETVLAIELLAACQALDLHRPLRTTKPLEAVHALIRTVVKPWDIDRQMNPDIEVARHLVSSGAVWEAVKPFLSENDHE